MKWSDVSGSELVPEKTVRETMGMSRSTWWRWMKSGAAPRCFQFGSRRFYRAEDVSAWMRNFESHESSHRTTFAGEDQGKSPIPSEKDLAALPHSLRVEGSSSGNVIATKDIGVCFVYGLVAKDEMGNVRYVGSTSSPHLRMKQHMGPSAAPALAEWRESVNARGSEVVMVSLWIGVDRREAYRAEVDLITEYRASGQADINTVVGLTKTVFRARKAAA